MHLIGPAEQGALCGNIRSMQGLSVTLAGVAFLLYLTATALADDIAQGVGVRQPDVSDWRAFHRQNDEYWARVVTATTGWRDAPMNQSKVRVSASEVRNMRLLAGIADDAPSDPILELAGHGMKVGQYLLVTVKANGCLNISVYGEGWHFKQIWSTDKLPNGSDICQQPACPEPRVSVGARHEIDIMIFSRSTPTKPICDRYSSASYIPKGSSFELSDQDAGTTMCRSSDAYRAGLNVALRQAAGPGELLVIVENLPALSPDRYALVLQRRSDGVRMLRLEWQREAWSRAAYAWNNTATTEECFSQAASFPVTVTALDISQKRMQELVTTLEQEDLRSDRCARRADRECAMILDGRAFSVQVGDNAPILLTDVKGLRGYASENPQLSEWVYELLGEAKHARSVNTH
jgi:hypothetical protein